MKANPKHIHLIGICGTAMASLAGMLKERGFRVTGSDAAAYPPMSTFLEELGIPVAQPFAEVSQDGGKPRAGDIRVRKSSDADQDFVTLMCAKYGWRFCLWLRSVHENSIGERKRQDHEYR